MRRAGSVSARSDPQLCEGACCFTWEGPGGVTGELELACGVVRHAKPDAECEGRRGFVTTDQHVDVSVLIVTYNSSSDVGSLIHDLMAVASDHSLRVVVVDN